MPYGNNALSKAHRKDKRQHFIDVAMKTKTVVDFLTFDLSSYFRVQYIVMFILKEVPFNLREFLLAAYYLQVTGQLVYNRRLHDICPHIKKTTLANLLKYDLVLQGDEVNTGRGKKAKTFIVHPYYFNKIERALKEGSATIRDVNSKERKRKQAAQANESAPDTGNDFLIDFE